MTQVPGSFGHGREPLGRDGVVVDPASDVLDWNAQGDGQFANADALNVMSEEHASKVDTLRGTAQGAGGHDLCQSGVSGFGMTEEGPSTRLRDARERRKVSRAQLAAKLGVSQSTLRAHENGQNGIQPAMAGQYAAELGVSPQWILYGHGDLVDGDSAPAKLSSIPVVGQARPGYHPNVVAKPSDEPLSLAVPGYDQFRLKAYAQEQGGREGFKSYVICAPWEGDALYLADEVVLRRSAGELAEIDIWKVGAEPGWIVFYKGQMQAQAHDLLKIKADKLGNPGLREGVWVLGLVVAHLEFMPHHRIRAFSWSK